MWMSNCFQDVRHYSGCSDFLFFTGHFSNFYFLWAPHITQQQGWPSLLQICFQLFYCSSHCPPCFARTVQKHFKHFSSCHLSFSVFFLCVILTAREERGFENTTGFCTLLFPNSLQDPASSAVSLISTFSHFLASPGTMPSILLASFQYIMFYTCLFPKSGSL